MDYKSKIEQEITQYRDNEKVHDLPPSCHFLTEKYLKPLLIENIGVENFNELIVSRINKLKAIKKENHIKILSLGSGNCDFELNLAQAYHINCKFTCYELNPHMIKRALKQAEELKLAHNFTFVEADINKINLKEEKYDIIIANHSLHHFVELEHIFNQIDNCMTDTSYFLINDMIGRNGHMFWDDTLDICNRLWDMVPSELKFNNQFKRYCSKLIQWDCSVDGFEGIRAQDILPLLDGTFKFECFGTFFSIVNRFIERAYGPNFDINNPMHRFIIDMIWNYDVFFLENKLLKPTQMIASVIKKDVKVENYSYTYFSEPSEVYSLEENRIYNYFDRKVQIEEWRAVLINNLGFSSTRPIMIWGAGSYGFRVLKKLKESKIKVLGFIDSNKNKWGTTFENLPIYSPEFISQQKDSKKRPYIILGSMYADQIIPNLQKIGYQEEKDFITNIF